MDAQDYFRTLITANQTMWRPMPGDRNFVSHSYENYKYHLPVAGNDGTACKLPDVINTSFFFHTFIIHNLQ
jgi:hypothetical protein